MKAEILRNVVIMMRNGIEDHQIIDLYRPMGTAVIQSLCKDINTNQILTQDHSELSRLFWQHVQTTSNILTVSYEAKKLEDSQIKFGDICSRSCDKATLSLGAPRNCLLFYRLGKFIFGGFIHHGYCQGSGIIVFQTRKAYIGEFKQGKYAGKGQFSFICDNNSKKVQVKIETNRSQDSIVGSVSVAKGKKLAFQLNESDIKRTPHKYVRYKNGDEYIGEWKDGFPSGIGKYIHKNGEGVDGYPYYQGQFLRGERQGMGTLHYDCCKSLKIRWRQGRPEGDGELSINDYIEKVNFENGERVFKRVSEIE